MRIRRALPALGLGLLFGACTVGATGPGPGDDDDDPDPPGDGTIAGSLTEDQTWSGSVVISGSATIEAGVTITVEPGADITAPDGAVLTVKGTLEVLGTEAAPVSIVPAAGATRWAGIVVEAGGGARLEYVEGTGVAQLLYCKAGTVTCVLDHVDFVDLAQAIVAESTASVTSSRIVDIANGGVTVRGAGDLTIRDSYILTSGGDLIVQNGGTLLVEYSEIGDTLGSYDHCNFHVGSAGSLTITRTNIINGVVGMMLGGTTNASITYNNWMGNGTDLQEIGTNTGVDMRFNYWEAGAPQMGAAYDVSSPAAAVIDDAGPRAAL